MKKKAITIISLCIITGILSGWLEEINSNFYIPLMSLYDSSILFFLISIFLTTLFVTLSHNITLSIASFLTYLLSYNIVKIVFGYKDIASLLTVERLLTTGIIIVFTLTEAIFLYFSSRINDRYREKIKEVRLQGDVAFPIVVFLLSIVLSSIFTLLDQRLFFSSIPVNSFFILSCIALLCSVCSLNEISGFFIGIFAPFIYFLLSNLITSNFQIVQSFEEGRQFYFVAITYSILFSLSTLLVARSSRQFVDSLLLRRAILKKETLVKAKPKSEEKVAEKEKVPASDKTHN